MFKKAVIAASLLFLVFIIYLAFKPFIKLEKVEIDDTYEEVVSKVSMPVMLLTEENICDLKILTISECNSFINLGANEIGYWKLGIDTWGVIGFSAEKKVVKKLLVDS